MKFRHIIATAVLLAPIPFVGMTEDAAARNTHAITIKGEIGIGDYGGTGKSEFHYEQINKVFNLTHDNPRDAFSWRYCAGGEVVGYVSIWLALNDADDRVVEKPTLTLYEGATCSTRDLVKQRVGAGHAIRVGQSRIINSEIRNTEIASIDDFLRVNLRIAHGVGADIGRPTEPSHVVADVPLSRLLCLATKKSCPTKSVYLTWQDEATNETAYEVRNTSREEIRRVPANTTSFSWPGIGWSEKHCFQVRAVNDKGASDWTPAGTAVACA